MKPQRHNCSPALLLYRRLAALLQARLAADSAAPGPDWVDPSTIESLTLRLVGDGVSRALPVLEVALRDGLPGAVLPTQWPPGRGDATCRLRPVRAARMLAQAAPALRRALDPCLEGTATALVRDCLAPDRNYLITCGHVVAPHAEVRPDEPVQIVGAVPPAGSGRLAEWQPTLGGLAYRTSLDAALVEVGHDDCLALQRDGSLLAAGWGGRPKLDLPVSLRRRSHPLAAALKIHWSGWVDLPSLTPGVADYFLADAVGYATAEPTVGGDSGAALWSPDDHLMGMHLGAIPDAGPGQANAVMGLIGPVLEWFSVQPYLRDDPAMLSPPVQPQRVAPPVPAPGAAADGDVVSIVARTLWGEARGEGEAGLRAVASVIGNRLRRHHRGAADAAAVCLARNQFSCWNDGDPNLARMEAVRRSPDAVYLLTCRIARELLAGSLPDSTRGATHYVASSLRQRPSWLHGKQPCAVIGAHEFYNDID